MNEQSPQSKAFNAKYNLNNPYPAGSVEHREFEKGNRHAKHLWEDLKARNDFAHPRFFELRDRFWKPTPHSKSNIKPVSNPAE